MAEETPETIPDGRYMTVEEAATYMRVKRTTFDKFVRKHQVPTCNYCVRVRIYDRQDIDEAIQKTKEFRGRKQPGPLRADAEQILGVQA